MPLLDHFHAPLHPRYAWESFHSLWCGAILAQLNRVLPARFFGQVNVHLGRRVAADVAEFDMELLASVSGNGAEGGVLVAPWAPPAATVTIDALFPDDIEVQVFDTRDGAVLVAVVELVSPANKDRDEAREAFTAKCAAYLQRGIGLVVVDVVTSRQFNLHDELMDRLGQADSTHLPDASHVYSTAYRPARRQDKDRIDIWTAPLRVGQPLPTLPLALRGTGCVPLDLESSYSAARETSRI